MRGLCKAKLRLKTSLAETLFKALEPDNKVLPSNLKIECTASPGALECEIIISCEDDKDILRLRNTLDDILSSIKVVLMTLELTSESL